MEFNERLKHYREKAGYKTAKDFAKKLELPYPTYVAYENTDREPKFSLLVKIAQLLNVSTDDLLGITSDKFSWFKGVLENNGFSVSKADKNENGEQMYFVENLEFLGDRAKEIFYYSQSALEYYGSVFETGDQNNLHDRYLDVFRDDRMENLKDVFWEIEYEDYYKDLRQQILKNDPKFFLYFAE